MQTTVSSENKAQAEHSGIIFMKELYHLIHTARIHKDNNQLIRDCLSRFKEILDDMTRDDDLKIHIWRGRFHVNEEKLPYRRDTVNIVNQIMKYFSTRGIGGLHFLLISRKALPKDILNFIHLLDISVKHDNPPEWLESKLGVDAISWVKILEKKDDNIQDSGSGHGVKRRERAKNAYLSSLETVREVADKAARGVAGVRKARRLAQTIVDLIQEDTSLILGLATIKDYDDYTYAHSVNVSLLATCLGTHIGLSRVSLEYLSVCGLFHDLGKVGVSKEVLYKKGELNAEEWKDIQSHPLIGVKKILRLNADKALRSRIILGPFEHHLNPDMTGYPKTHFMKKLSLMGKILRIADVYDALTSERSYRPRSFTPDEALRKMWSEREKSFNTVLLKSFIQMLGVYPIGSVVELNDGRIAVVMDYPGGSQKVLPIVLTLIEDGEGGMARGEMVNLSTLIGKDGLPGLGIAGGVLPSSIGVPVAQFFLEEN